MPTSDWAPGVVNVGAILRARTKDRSQNEVGTFTADTRPTGDQVAVLIEQAVSDVVDVVGSDLPTPTWGSATYVAALSAAMQVELSYFPEQVGTGRSPYAQLKDLYDVRLERLRKAVIAERAGGNEVDPSAALAPSYDFPMTGDPFIIGRRTAW
jgi:hypothetical protein